MLGKCTKCGQVVEPINGYCPYCDNDMHEFEEDPIDYSKEKLRELNKNPKWVTDIIIREKTKRITFTIACIICSIGTITLFTLGFVFENLLLCAFGGILFFAALVCSIFAVKAHKPFFYLNKFGNYVIGYALIQSTTALYVNGRKIKTYTGDIKRVDIEGWEITCTPKYMRETINLVSGAIVTGRRATIVGVTRGLRRRGMVSLNEVEFTAVKIKR